ncbi:MAG: hypothetical protein ACWGQW_08010 [bacterium]
MAVVCTTRRIEGIRSIIGGGALSEDLVLELSGDENNPGQLYYYGTNSNGRKGWYALPENISDLVALENRVASLENRMTAAESLIQTNITDIAALDVRITVLEAWMAVDGVSWAITGVDYAVASGINHVKCTASGITITLPAATSVRKIVVKNQSTGDITIASASLMDTYATVTLPAEEAAQFVADGTIWNIV